MDAAVGVAQQLGSLSLSIEKPVGDLQPQLNESLAGPPSSIASSDSGDSFVFAEEEGEEGSEHERESWTDAEIVTDDDDGDDPIEQAAKAGKPYTIPSKTALEQEGEMTWDWEWNTLRKDESLCRQAREAAEALLAQILEHGYLYTGDSCPASACFTHPHSTAGSTPIPYRLGLRPGQLLLNAAAPPTPVSTPILKRIGLPEDTPPSRKDTTGDLAFKPFFLRLQ